MYRNVFCATCNNARNTRLWNLEPRKCPDDPISYCGNQTSENLLECYTAKCSYNYKPSNNAVTKDCLPRKPICLKDSYYDLGKTISLKDMCFFYILNAALKREWPKKRLNFHCDLCNGQNDVGCFSLASYVPPPP